MSPIGKSHSYPALFNPECSVFAGTNPPQSNILSIILNLKLRI